MFTGSWKTTISGLLAACAGIFTQLNYIFDADPTTNFSLEACIAIVVGAGLLFARDDNVSSEAVRRTGTEVK